MIHIRFFYIDADPDPVLPFKVDVKIFIWARDTVLFTFYLLFILLFVPVNFIIIILL